MRNINLQTKDTFLEISGMITRLISIFFLLLFATILSTGCLAVDKKQLAAAEFGPQPNQVATQQLHEFALKGLLKDPFSVRFQHSLLHKAAYRPNIWVQPKYGWLLTTRVNAKNSYGAYAGWESFHLFLPKGGKPTPARLLGVTLENGKSFQF